MPEKSYVNSVMRTVLSVLDPEHAQSAKDIQKQLKRMERSFAEGSASKMEKCGMIRTANASRMAAQMDSTSMILCSAVTVLMAARNAQKTILATLVIATS